MSLQENLESTEKLLEPSPPVVRITDYRTFTQHFSYVWTVTQVHLFFFCLF